MDWRPGELSDRIEFVRSAAKACTLLDPVLQRRVDRELSRLSETPRHAGVIRLQSEDPILLVLIVKIGHWGSIYRA